MNKNKKGIILLLLGTLIIIVGTGIYLYYRCLNTNHLKEVCPITKILNVIYYVNPNSKLIGKHQIKSMLIAYQENNVDIESIKYGEIIEPIYNVYTKDAIIHYDDSGKLYYEAKEGYILQEDGSSIRKVQIGTQFRGLYGITTYFKDGTSSDLVTLDFSGPFLK